MCKVDEGYKKYITYEKGNKVMYMKLDKALYGCVQSALLWHNTFKSKLEQMGFKINPYDPYIANKEINNKQCTKCWFVDDMKNFHEDYSVVSKVTEEIESDFGKMKVMRGNQRIFVGINFYLNLKGKVIITMKDCIKECVHDLIKELG